MKITTEVKKPEKTINLLSFDSAYDHAREIYGNPEIILDDKCLCGIEVNLGESLNFTKFVAKYSKVKFKIATGHEIYWPIKQHEQEISVAKGLEMLHRFIQKQEEKL